MLERALAWIQHLGPWAPPVFIAAYVLACVLMIPASILTLGGGAIFGLWRGALYVCTAALLGATAAFLTGRHAARAWVSRKLAGNARFAAIDEAVAREGWRIVLLTRLCPVFPFILLNYAFGLTKVSLKDFILGSLGLIPGTFLFVYAGSLAGDVAALGSARGGPRSQAQWAFYGLGLIATIILLLYITRLARRSLDQKLRR